MAIQIIGASRDKEPAKQESPLPVPQVSLPATSSAPEAAPVRSPEEVLKLLESPHALVRLYAVHRLENLTGDAYGDALLRMIDDADPHVAETAVAALEHRAYAPAAEKLAAKFKTATPRLAAAIAAALARISPPALLEAVKARPRIEGGERVVVLAELAQTGLPEAVEYFTRSMNRAGTLDAERRTELYAAALRSGAPALLDRIVSLAVDDSTKPLPPEGASPARAALVVHAGLPVPLAFGGAAAKLLSSLPEQLEVLEKLLGADAVARVRDAVRQKRIAAAIRALAEEMPRQIDDRLSDEGKKVVGRRRALLDSILKAAPAIEKLSPEAATLFAMVAIESAGILAGAKTAAGDTPAGAAIAKALGLEPAALASLDAAGVKAKLAATSDRDVRRIARILSTEPLGDDRLLERLVSAGVETGHGTAFIDAAGEAKVRGMPDAVLRALESDPVKGEPVIVEALERRPLEKNVAGLALAAAGRTGTQRVALAIGRRYLELRESQRMVLADAVLRLGDTRLAPLVESRAFPDEPEEMVWATLRLLDGAPVEGRLKEALDRLDHPPGMQPGGADALADVDGIPSSKVALELRCKRCKEALQYVFKRVYVDPRSKEASGDPAFVGDPICKACGAVDQFEPTDAAIREMTDRMLTYMAAVRAGATAEVAPAVLPRLTRITGKETGLAAALRTLEQQVAESPENIRYRLRRARMRLILQRSGAKEDADSVLAIDPESPEAMMVLAGVESQKRDDPGAVELLARAARRLRSAEPPRLYESEAEPLLEEIEDTLVRMELYGVKLPEDLPLEEARRRLEDEARRGQEEAPPAEEEEAPAPAASEAEVPVVGRNDPCPCGSGQKYKKCHGRER